MSSNNPNNPFGDPGEITETFRDGGQGNQPEHHSQPIAYGGEDATANPFAGSSSSSHPIQQPAHSRVQQGTHGMSSQGNSTTSPYMADLIDLQHGTSEPPTPASALPTSTASGMASYPPQAAATSRQQQQQQPFTTPTTYPPAPSQPGQLRRMETFNTDTGKYHKVYVLWYTNAWFE